MCKDTTPAAYESMTSIRRQSRQRPAPHLLPSSLCLAVAISSCGQHCSSFWVPSQATTIRSSSRLSAAAADTATGTKTTAGTGYGVQLRPIPMRNHSPYSLGWRKQCRSDCHRVRGSAAAAAASSPAVPGEKLSSSDDAATTGVTSTASSALTATPLSPPPTKTIVVDDECFLGADGGQYCVVEPTTAQPFQQQRPTAAYPTEAYSPETARPNSPVGAIVGPDRAALVDNSSVSSLYTMMGLCFLVAIVCALDRVAMSVAIVSMGDVYGYSDTTKGLISSVFSWGYMASMVPSSVLIGVWGPKATMAAGVLAWSAAQMLSPTAAALSLPTLLACRFAMGVGEAVTLPSIQAIVAEWVPQDQRNRWLSLIISGLQVGTVLAYLASPAIISAWNWQGVFIAYGALGLAWLALWLPTVPDRVPAGLATAVAASSTNAQQQQRRQQELAVTGADDGYRCLDDDNIMSGNVEEAKGVNGTALGAKASAGAGVATSEYIMPAKIAGKRNGANLGALSTGSGANGDRGLSGGFSMETVEVGAKLGREVDVVRTEGDGESEDGKDVGVGGGVLGGFRDVPWKEYATNGQIWSIASAHMAHNWGLYVMLAWLPTYFTQEFNLSLGQSSGASVIPWVAGAVTGNMAGWGADALVNKGIFDLKTVRKLFQTLALVGPAACMLALAQGPESSSAASFLFTLAVALGSCSCAGFGSSVQDLKSKHTGVIYGMTSACSAVVGSAGTFLTGVVLDTTDSWAFVFQATAAVYLIGAVVYGIGYRAEPLLLKDVEA